MIFLNKARYCSTLRDLSDLLLRNIRKLFSSSHVFVGSAFGTGIFSAPTQQKQKIAAARRMHRITIIAIRTAFDCALNRIFWLMNNLVWPTLLLDHFYLNKAKTDGVRPGSSSSSFFFFPAKTAEKIVQKRQRIDESTVITAVDRWRVTVKGTRERVNKRDELRESTRTVNQRE